MIKQTLAGKDKNKELALAKAKAMRMKLDLLSLNGLDTSDLETINIEFNKQLINYKKNILYKRYIFNLGKTPKYLIEKGLPNTTVKMKQKVLKKAIDKKHDLLLSHFINMPKMLNEIKDVFISDTKDKSFVIATKTKDLKGKIIIILQIKSNKKDLEIINIPSVYGRNRYKHIFKKWESKGLKI